MTQAYVRRYETKKKKKVISKISVDIMFASYACLLLMYIGHRDIIRHCSLIGIDLNFGNNLFCTPLLC